MKKITFNALLNHKAHNYKPMQIEVEKVIPIYGKRFEQIREHPLDDCPEIIENRDLMYMKGNTAHCILFLDANGSDGILVEAEGADYARKSQFIPNARAIIEANDITAGERQLHAELKAIRLEDTNQFIECVFIEVPFNKRVCFDVQSVGVDFKSNSSR